MKDEFGAWMQKVFMLSAFIVCATAVILCSMSIVFQVVEYIKPSTAHHLNSDVELEYFSIYKNCGVIILSVSMSNSGEHIAKITHVQGEQKTLEYIHTVRQVKALMQFSDSYIFDGENYFDDQGNVTRVATLHIHRRRK